MSNIVSDKQFIEYIDTNNEKSNISICKKLVFYYKTETNYISYEDNTLLYRTLNAFKDIEKIIISGNFMNYEHFIMFSKLPNLKRISFENDLIFLEKKNCDRIIFNDNLEQIDFNSVSETNPNIHQNIQNLLAKLPTNLKKLFINTEIKLNIDNLPANLETLVIVGNYPNSLDLLPVHLKELVLSESAAPYLYDEYSIENPNYLSNLPANLEKLFIYSYSSSLDNLPKNLKALKIINFNYKGTHVTLPETLTSFICYNIKEIKKIYLNNSLEVLILGEINKHFTTQLDLSTLPNTIHTLKLTNYIDKFLDGTYKFPSNLKNLYTHHTIYQNKSNTKSTNSNSNSKDNTDDFNILDIDLFPKTLENLYLLYYRLDQEYFNGKSDMCDYPKITIKHGSLKIKFIQDNTYDYDYLDPNTNYFHF